jgi:glycosyltransferase involved in cell wall biosynthesis
MRIGVDATCWQNKRGYGRFTRELLEAVLEVDKTNEYLFFVDPATDKSGELPVEVQKIVVKTKVAPIEAASAEGRRSLGDIWAMSREVMRHKLDLFFFPTVYSYFPIFSRTKVIVTVHDVIAEHHPDLIFPDAKSKFFWRLKQKAAIRQADIIATVSEYSKQQIIEYFGVAPSRLRIISEAARPAFRVLDKAEAMSGALGRYNIGPDEKFLLYVGGISPHKNLSTLVTAFEVLNKADGAGRARLVLVGDYEGDSFFSAYPSLKEQIGGLGLDEQITFTGYVPDEDLAYLYNGASALVFPSLEEGFGLPAVEAMACGTPVAASNCGSLPEVIGSAGRYFDPRDSMDIANVLSQILNDDALRTSMKEAGLRRSKEFLWNKAAHETLTIFDELVIKPLNDKPITTARTPAGSEQRP